MAGKRRGPRTQSTWASSFSIWALTCSETLGCEDQEAGKRTCSKAELSHYIPLNWSQVQLCRGEASSACSHGISKCGYKARNKISINT